MRPWKKSLKNHSRWSALDRLVFRVQSAPTDGFPAPGNEGTGWNRPILGMRTSAWTSLTRAAKECHISRLPLHNTQQTASALKIFQTCIFAKSCRYRDPPSTGFAMQVISIFPHPWLQHDTSARPGKNLGKPSRGGNRCHVGSAAGRLVFAATWAHTTSIYL